MLIRSCPGVIILSLLNKVKERSRVLNLHPGDWEPNGGLHPLARPVDRDIPLGLAIAEGDIFQARVTPKKQSPRGTQDTGKDFSIFSCELLQFLDLIRLDIDRQRPFRTIDVDIKGREPARFRVGQIRSPIV